MTRDPDDPAVPPLHRGRPGVPGRRASRSTGSTSTGAAALEAGRAAALDSGALGRRGRRRGAVGRRSRPASRRERLAPRLRARCPAWVRAGRLGRWTAGPVRPVSRSVRVTAARRRPRSDASTSTRGARAPTTDRAERPRQRRRHARRDPAWQDRRAMVTPLARPATAGTATVARASRSSSTAGASSSRWRMLRGPRSADGHPSRDTADGRAARPRSGPSFRGAWRPSGSRPATRSRPARRSWSWRR